MYVERPFKEVDEIIRCCEDNDINFLDCWMSKPTVRIYLIKGDFYEKIRFWNDEVAFA